MENHIDECILHINDENRPKRKRLSWPNSSTDIIERAENTDASVPFIKKQKCANMLDKTTLCSDYKKTNCITSNQESHLTGNFNSGISLATPLAEQMQPKCLSDFFGQEHVLGKNTFLRSLLEEKEVPSMILWGPPGCGKTSLANIINEMCQENPERYKFLSMCAANCGVNEVQNVIVSTNNDAKFGQRTVLFMDEIHRFNKRQQSTLLANIVKGDIILIGATTENPSFTLSNILLDSCKVIVMEKLQIANVMSIIETAAAKLNIGIVDDHNTLYNMYQIKSLCIRRSAIRWLADTCDGDARIALNNFQLMLQPNKDKKIVTVANVKEGIQKSHLLYDRDGEEHHNIISAMHESIKGYSDNAALYWTARMIEGGEDPLFIARRLVRAASEDIGNADPKALQLAVSTMHACQVLDVPNTDVLLAQCAVYLARAPTTKQLKSALALVKQNISKWRGPQPPVPVHLCDFPKKLMKDLCYNKPSKDSRQSFMPKSLENLNFL